MITDAIENRVEALECQVYGTFLNQLVDTSTRLDEVSVTVGRLDREVSQSEIEPMIHSSIREWAADVKHEILQELGTTLIDRIVEVLAEHFDFQRTEEDDRILEEKLRAVLFSN